MFIESGKNQPDDVKLKLIDLCVPEQSFKFPGRQYNDNKHKSGVYTSRVLSTGGGRGKLPPLNDLPVIVHII